MPATGSRTSSSVTSTSSTSGPWLRPRRRSLRSRKRSLRELASRSWPRTVSGRCVRSGRCAQGVRSGHGGCGGSDGCRRRSRRCRRGAQLRAGRASRVPVLSRSCCCRGYRCVAVLAGSAVAACVVAGCTVPRGAGAVSLSRRSPRWSVDRSCSVEPRCALLGGSVSGDAWPAGAWLERLRGCFAAAAIAGTWLAALRDGSSAASGAQRRSAAAIGACRRGTGAAGSSAAG